MVQLVLDDFRRPAGEGFQPGLEFFVLPPDLDGLEALGLSGAGEGQTALLRLVGAGTLDDHGVEHHHVSPLVVKGDDVLVHADHVGCHAHAAAFVGSQGVQQVLGCGQVVQGGGLGLLGEKSLISANFSDHGRASLVFKRSVH